MIVRACCDGTVYRAFDNVLNRVVAIKIPTPAIVHSEQDYGQFHDEAMAAAGLNHHGIIRIFDAGDLGDGTPFISMEFCEGPTLADWLNRESGREPMRPFLATRLVQIMAQAVEHAHEKGIVHRDLKPENTLLEPAPARGSALGVELLAGAAFIPRICDFGLTRMSHTVPLTGMEEASSVAGTMNYMAPEQMLGQVGSSVDVFALGVIFHRLLTGYRPFVGNDLQQRYDNIQQGALPNLYATHGLSRDVVAICVKAMAFDVARRYTSAGDFLLPR